VSENDQEQLESAKNGKLESIVEFLGNWIAPFGI